jgi:competence protein ComEA
MFKTIIAIVVTTVVVLIIMAVVDKTTSSIVSSTPKSSSVSVSDTLQVTITGEVNHTGTYLVALKSTLADLLEAAGGTTSNADPKAFDTNFLLEDKQSFFIAPIYDNGNTCAVTPISKVCVNSADKAALQGVSAFSSTVAGNIVSYREANGAFKRLEELKNVSGIGNATFEKCKNFVTLTE